LDTAIAEFTQHLEAERRASPHTRAAYGSDLRQLLEYVKTTTAERPRLEDLDRTRLRAFLGQLARTRGHRTIARKVATVRSFFRFLERRAVLSENPARLLGSPKVGRRLPEFLG